LGEFEQGRPVIEALKKNHPEIAILLTFFSPSGYEIRKNYDLADCVAYLPSDTLVHANKMVRLFKFEAVFFVKYEFWFNYMHAIQKQHIPLYFISARFRKNQHFFAWYGTWFRNQLTNVSHFFVQDSGSANLLITIGIKNVTVTGDTRFDRVASLANTAKRFEKIEMFIGNHKLFIAGSTWPEDEKFLLEAIKKLPENYKIIIAPHDVSTSHIANLQKQLEIHNQLYSQFDSNNDCKILIINNIGILSQLYQYARFVYIGGGFGNNIHNIQEPVTFGCPVIFGPKYENFTEAVDLKRLGGAFSVVDQETLENIMMRLVSNEKFRDEASLICKKYVGEQIGATNKILDQLNKQF
jgi:3-deoxy-D-manno-octulosonic-acid transferase